MVQLARQAMLRTFYFLVAFARRAEHRMRRLTVTSGLSEKRTRVLELAACCFASFAGGEGRSALLQDILWQSRIAFK